MGALAPIVLASRSPQRRELLTRLKLDFTVRVSEAEELEQGDPDVVTVENALRKARAVRRADVPETIVGCDTVVVLDGHIYGKPADEKAALATAGALAGRTHEVVSGLAVLIAGEERTAVARTAVTFRALDADGIASYVSTGEWRERSGGYAIQGEGSKLVESIEGEIENVVGLPLSVLLQLCPELRA
ncbi:MAG TPA: Maf family protein [Solirubrobacteraceae bacterium]|jgi:septum formation protein